MAGGADDRTDLEVNPLPWKTHLCTGPNTGQVVRIINQSYTNGCFTGLAIFLFYFFFPAPVPHFF